MAGIVLHGDLLIALAPAALKHCPKQGLLRYHSIVKRDVHILK